MVELPVDGSQGTRWVLTVGIQSGAPAGGSETVYFVGQFDGNTFTSDNPLNTLLWVDYGADYHALRPWNNDPGGRCITNNWQYANLIPATIWRGAFSLPRQMTLIQTAEGIRLLQQPIPELMDLRAEHMSWRNQTITPGENLLAGLQSNSFEIIADFKADSTAECFGFRVRIGQGEFTTIAYLPREHKVCLDRTHSGPSDFYPGFARIHTANLSYKDASLRLQIFVDHSSVEIFANDGVVTLSDSISPSDQSLSIELFSQVSATHLTALDFYQLSQKA